MLELISNTEAIGKGHHSRIQRGTKPLHHQCDLHDGLIDLKNVFDRVCHAEFRATINQHNINEKLHKYVHQLDLYENISIAG